ncbi:Cfr10I/Bse634I family restriction endonuclease [Leclercia adecarboxylata]|uniref:Cfr10I/Bse634I family restriction endonuclease n=1 Tax=Leclercia adecarboxylata TaxID=83655 RepID=UPI0019522E08|nr:Cfr10I/Bse634I family restriction endonuclease [Leclercia adecarboxylata]MBM6634447.1 Cfr10I/Bse634I family restriction endonuclease [Leclercia adecarboxylata]
MNILSNSRAGDKFTINPAYAFIEYASKVNLYNMEFDAVLAGLKKLINDEAFHQGGKVNEGAFNKCNGDWYEWLIGIRAIEYFVQNNVDRLVVKIPNASSFDVISVYKDYLSSYIHDLRKKLSHNNVNLVTSNPDFIVLETADITGELKKALSWVTLSNITMDTLSCVEFMYKDFINYANLDQLRSFLSVKTSFRPDRRLQLAHEGSLMKALYTHLQTRTWNINPAGVKYYAAATVVGNADIIGLKTVATHSITDVKSLPQSAVDEIFKINSVQDVDNCLNHILFS